MTRVGTPAIDKAFREEDGLQPLLGQASLGVTHQRLLNLSTEPRILGLEW